MQSYNLTHLKELESEAIFIIREVAAQFEKACNVILRRKGFDHHVSFSEKSFLPWQNSVSTYAC